jgi:hypothetical protein
MVIDRIAHPALFISVGLCVMGVKPLPRSRPDYSFGPASRIISGAITAKFSCTGATAYRADHVIKTTPAHKDAKGGTYTDSAVICGAIVKTPELNEVRPGGGLPCRDNNEKYCFERTDLVVSTPNERWVFADGTAFLDCAQDNQGSCAWNQLDRPQNLIIDSFNPTTIRAHVWTNSRSVGIRLGAFAKYYP